MPILVEMSVATTLLRLFLPVRAFARHAGPHLLEATVGPTVCFLTGRALWGVDGALALALGWTAACMALRHLRGRRMSGLLVIGMTTLVLRATVSFALHSERAYLIAPAVVTIVMGLVYVVSALTTKPLLGRVLGDLIPAKWLNPNDPGAARLCRIGSIVWGAEQIICAVISLGMILSVSTTTYVVFHEFVSWLVAVTVIGAVVPFFWTDVRGLWAQRSKMAPAVAPAAA